MMDANIIFCKHVKLSVYFEKLPQFPGLLPVLAVIVFTGVSCYKCRSMLDE